MPTRTRWSAALRRVGVAGGRFDGALPIEMDPSLSLALWHDGIVVCDVDLEAQISPGTPINQVFGCGQSRLPPKTIRPLASVPITTKPRAR